MTGARRLSTLPLLGVCLLGCGQKYNLVEVKGTAKLRNVPLKGVRLDFIPEPGTDGPLATGVTDEQGNFTIRPGAVAGWHMVTVVDPLAVGGDDLEDPLNPKKGRAAPKKSPNPPIPSQYLSQATTSLKVEVKPGQPVELTLAP